MAKDFDPLTFTHRSKTKYGRQYLVQLVLAGTSCILQEEFLLRNLVQKENIGRQFKPLIDVSGIRHFPK